MRTITRSLITLSEDPLLRDEFWEQPDSVLARFEELTEEERDILRSRDPERIRRLFGENQPPHRDFEQSPPGPPPPHHSPPHSPPPKPKTPDKKEEPPGPPKPGPGNQEG